MPQMAPIGWLSLFIVFTISFMLFNVMNYYSNIPVSPKSSDSAAFSAQSMMWKW